MGLTDRIAAAYDQIADDYARRNNAMPPALLHFGQKFLSLAGATPKLLDVGCGTGRDMQWLETQGAQMTGIDISARMLAIARTHVHGSLLQMDMRSLAFAPASFDGIWCVASLLHLPKDMAPAALNEMRRVLKPGGVLHLTMQEGSEETWESQPYNVVERFFARYSQEEAVSLLMTCHFRVVELDRDQGHDRHWLQILAIPMAARNLEGA